MKKVLAQGLYAVIKWRLKEAQNKEAFILDRTNSYIGVLVVLFGFERSQRALSHVHIARWIPPFSARRQRRYALVWEMGYKIGSCATKWLWQFLEDYQRSWEKFNTTFVNPQAIANANSKAAAFDPNTPLLINLDLAHEVSLSQLIKRPNINFKNIDELAQNGLIPSSFKSDELNSSFGANLVAEIIAQVEIGFKYSGYIEKQRLEIEKLSLESSKPIPPDFSYIDINGLSTEIKQKLTKDAPKTIGQAHAISGVTPSAISILLVYLKTRFDKYYAKPEQPQFWLQREHHRRKWSFCHLINALHWARAKI